MSSTFDKANIDYSVYLVTGRELLPPGVDYYEFLEKCLSQRNVTVVQIREKDAETSEFLEIATKSLAICDKYDVPMLINDNLAVCLALPERVGLHIGQEDIPVAEARRILGDKRVLGISIKSVDQAKKAREEGKADYAGVGPCYGTLSKAGITEDKVIGIAGAQKVVEELGKGEKRLPCVLIGGLNQKTAARTLFGVTSGSNAPDGIAVISAIVGRKDSDKAAEELATIVRAYKTGLAASAPSQGHLGVASGFSLGPSSPAKDVEWYTNAAADLLSFHRESTHGPPLIQTITSMSPPPCRPTLLSPSPPPRSCHTKPLKLPT